MVTEYKHYESAYKDNMRKRYVSTSVYHHERRIIKKITGRQIYAKLTSSINHIKKAE